MKTDPPQVKADYKTISLINAAELYTKGFNITTPEDSNLAVDYPGTHLGLLMDGTFF
jgi:hypothetical protein